MQRILSLASGGLCGGALFAIMVLTFFDVGGRKFLDSSIPGSLELTELLMVIVIFAGLPLVTARSEHVVFDSLDAYIPSSLRRVQQALVHVVCALAMLGLAWIMWQTGAQIAGYGETTAQLKINKGPFVQAIGVACLFTAFVHAWLVARPTPAGSNDGEEATPGAAT